MKPPFITSTYQPAPQPLQLEAVLDLFMDEEKETLCFALKSAPAFVPFKWMEQLQERARQVSGLSFLRDGLGDGLALESIVYGSHITTPEAGVLISTLAQSTAARALSKLPAGDIDSIFHVNGEVCPWSTISNMKNGIQWSRKVKNWDGDVQFEHGTLTVNPLLLSAQGELCYSEDTEGQKFLPAEYVHYLVMGAELDGPPSYDQAFAEGNSAPPAYDIKRMAADASMEAITEKGYERMST
ncbi:hypothetical protein N8T08_004813 [Aspergillus melleus]|uniref:Uncharacterized protein n=1 Tax=Aspergillus melleus TaxID=138277 RepID=A0ACC3B327_9EURO|nr:hypothetical protein N8T08_004813 [Aspergillus melleus]